MKTIGVLGGMSWESTLDWYRSANQIVRERLGGFHSARLLIDSVDFADIEAMQTRGEWHAAGELLAERAKALEAAGAAIIVLCTNTMHLVADQIEAALEVPLLHIVDVTAEAIQAAGVGRLGLLGTAFTMEHPFYRERLQQHGIDVVVPTEPDRKTVHSIIYDELVKGIITDASRQVFREIIERLVADGAEGVVLGCTEIELLVSQEDSSVPVFATSRLHVEAALRAAGV